MSTLFFLHCHHCKLDKTTSFYMRVGGWAAKTGLLGLTVLYICQMKFMGIATYHKPTGPLIQVMFTVAQVTK